VWRAGPLSLLAVGTTFLATTPYALLDRARDFVRQLHFAAGFNIGINDGLAAGQTDPHLQLHLIPRYPGDIADPRGGVRWIMPERAVYWKDR
jgi:diadenosine tetraphosphate (Ap4A) HIT family hydrolase